MKLKWVLSIKNILGCILLLFAGMFFYYYILEHDWQFKTLGDEEVKKYRISERKAADLYQLMKDVHEIFIKNNITYWIDGGTLLGAVRHQGLIPFDDDLDIGIMHDDEIKLQQILPQFEQLGYSISFEKAYNICAKVCIDIFIFHKDQDKLIHTNLNIRSKYPNDFFYSYELYPLKKYKFGDLEVYGPYNPRENLNRLYPDWDKYAIIHFPHSTHLPFLSNVEKKTKFILTPEFLKPVKTSRKLEDHIK